MLGLGATVWLVFAYPMRQGREEFVPGKVEDLVVAAGIAAVIGVLVALVYPVALLVYAVNSCFRAGAIHELLPPVLSPLLLWEIHRLRTRYGLTFRGALGRGGTGARPGR